MIEATTLNVGTASAADLCAVYNRLTGEAVRKMESRPAAVRRIVAAMSAAGIQAETLAELDQAIAARAAGKGRRKARVRPKAAAAPRAPRQRAPTPPPAAPSPAEVIDAYVAGKGITRAETPGDRLEQTRAILGWSRPRLAAPLGCDEAMVRMWERHLTPVPAEILAWTERLAAGIIAAGPPPQDWRSPARRKAA